MCIIVAKNKKAKFPSKQVLKNCFKNNSDGAGIMYVKNNKVVIDKGYMSFDSFYDKVKELKKEFSNYEKKAFVFHFRIATSGKTDEKTCHPFPISRKEKDLKATNTTCKIGLAHNGIISNFVYNSNNFSDTQNFVRDCIYNIYKHNKTFYRDKKILFMLEKICDSKLAILDNKENIYTVGDFIKEDGLLFSNNTYKDSYYSYKTYNSWEDWDNYYSKWESDCNV